MAKKQHKGRPRLLFADDRGTIYDHPELEMAVFNGAETVIPRGNLIRIPEMSKLFYLPNCPPWGYDPKTDSFVLLDNIELDGKRVPCNAVAGFLEPGYVRTMLPAADYTAKDYILPLWAYTAVGFQEKNTVACAFRVEYNHTWDPKNYDDRTLPDSIGRMKGRHPNNRLLQHLVRCATENHCFAAKNLFWGRWEAPIPVSRSCNARCLGCLSLQSESSAIASHQRIDFRPTVEEIIDIAVPHLENAPGAIISFGQGCEGEPLLEADLIAASIARIRSLTDRGSINLNTNGSLTTNVMNIMDAGLDCIRISMNSARPDLYHAYHRPVDFRFDDVVNTLSSCVKGGIYTMINYLVFPGINDQEDELNALFHVINKTGVNFIHLKNLCIDPDYYLKAMKERGPSPAIGLQEMSLKLRKEFPDIEIGYFNQPGFKKVTDFRVS